MHCLILGNTRAEEVMKDWKSEEWDGVCRQCCVLIERFKDILYYKQVKKYLELSPVQPQLVSYALLLIQTTLYPFNFALLFIEVWDSIPTLSCTSLVKGSLGQRNVDFSYQTILLFVCYCINVK